MLEILDVRTLLPNLYYNKTNFDGFEAINEGDWNSLSELHIMSQTSQLLSSNKNPPIFHLSLYPKILKET
jgi:hypothetical protein